jgi:hypothetical protein
MLARAAVELNRFVGAVDVAKTHRVGMRPIRRPQVGSVRGNRDRLTERREIDRVIIPDPVTDVR